MGIIKSAIDTDLYKLTMLQAFFNQAQNATAEYKFVCRTQGINLAQYAKQIEEELTEFCETVKFKSDELAWMAKLGSEERGYYFKANFMDFLEDFTFKKRYLKVEPSMTEKGAIEITASGPLIQVMLFEIPVLSIVNEVYFRNEYPNPDMKRAMDILSKKIDLAKSAPPGFKFSDFGTRRRFSRDWQETVVTRLKDSLPGTFTGTSNMDLARRYKLVPTGTMAHEFLQAYQALSGRLIDSQKMALMAWCTEYRGNNGIALTDVAGIDAFLRDFGLFEAKLFDGVRHDSGDPRIWGDKMIKHYEKLGIDPKTKTFVFSNGLDMSDAIALHRDFGDKVAHVYSGIGTKLTNDLGYTPLNIVMKMITCNGQPVAKISDDEGKTICMDQEFLAYFRKTFKIDPPSWSLKSKKM